LSGSKGGSSANEGKGGDSLHHDGVVEKRGASFFMALQQAKARWSAVSSNLNLTEGRSRRAKEKRERGERLLKMIQT
jgi:hypothetical protein